MDKFPVSIHASSIEYAIRDIVVPAMELERQGNAILKMNIGDPLAYPDFPTPSHMIDAFSKALKNQSRANKKAGKSARSYHQRQEKGVIGVANQTKSFSKSSRKNSCERLVHWLGGYQNGA